MFTRQLSQVQARLFREDWNVGVVPQSAEDIVRHGITRPVYWLPRHRPWSMLADPSVLKLADGRCILLAEYMNHWVGRGEIWATCLQSSGDVAQAVFRPWMKSTGHLSYPFLFHDETNRVFFMAESWEAGALHLWRLDNDVLQHVGPIINSPVVDPTPWHDGTTWWLFCTLKNDGPNEKLHLFLAPRLEGPWTPHAGNPVKRDVSSTRPAGPLFRAGSKLIRPAQNCARTYGGALVLNEIVRLDNHGFDEVPLRCIEPSGAYPDGLHTLCPMGDVTIIDGKRCLFQPLDLPRKLIAGVRSHTRSLRKILLPSHIVLPTSFKGLPESANLMQPIPSCDIDL